MQRSFRIILKPQPEGGFLVTVPSLPGCVTYGDTLEIAKDMAREAIDLYIEDMIENGEEIPDDSQNLEFSLIVS